MSDFYQRIYINGVEMINATATGIYSYTAPQIVINGMGQFLYELILYNYDMMDIDIERSAQSQIDAF